MVTGFSRDFNKRKTKIEIRTWKLSKFEKQQLGLVRKYKKRYGRNYPYSRYNKIGYIADSRR